MLASHSLVVITLILFDWLVVRVGKMIQVYSLSSCPGFFGRNCIFSVGTEEVTFIPVGRLSAMAAVQDEFEPFNVATQCGSGYLAEIPRVGALDLLDSVRSMRWVQMRWNKRSWMIRQIYVTMIHNIYSAGKRKTLSQNMKTSGVVKGVLAHKTPKQGSGRPDTVLANRYFQKYGYSQIIHFNRIFHYKPSIFRYPYFWKHPNESTTTAGYHGGSDSPIDNWHP